MAEGAGDRPLIRPAVVADAGDLAAVLTRDRSFLAPWDTVRDERFYRPEGQQDELIAAVGRQERGESASWVIVGHGDHAVGRINLNTIVRGAMQSATLGYWLAEAEGGRGIATRAVGEVLVAAFDVLGLHRVEAATLLHNVRSQRVLAKNGFRRFGTAPQYLRIAGEWQDHALFQRLATA